MSLDSFNRIATRPRHDSANQLIDRIIALRPDLRNETFIVPRSGNTALTVMTVNEVFKSCMSRGNPADFAREYAVLEHLQGRELGAKIPQLTWRSDDKSIYGMTRLHGEALSKDLLASLPADEQARIAAIIGRFNALIAAGIDDAQRAALGLQSKLAADIVTPGHVFEALEPSAAKVNLGIDALRVAVRVAEYCQQRFETHEQRLLSIHPDMHEQNIIYNRASGTVALIDIGAGQAVEAELGFCIPRHYYPRAFVAEMLAAFSAQSGETLTCAHLDVYFGMRALKMSLVNPLHALGEFKHHCAMIGQALDELQGKSAVSPAPSSEPAPTPYVPNMR